jgi:hypothetical protein
MKKQLLILFSLCLFTVSINAQNDTLLSEFFNDDPSAYIIVGAPTGGIGETLWTNFDEDAMPDGSPSGRPDEWFWSAPFATIDEFLLDGITENGVYASNSWSNQNAYTLNWLMTPSINIIDNTAMLYWKSAPRQTPKYLDGYMVLVSTTDNNESSFTDTLFKAAEYVSVPTNLPDSSFTPYTFSQGFVHGQDGSYIEYAGDSARFIGELRPFSASLANYAGQQIYIAFLHRTMDDNLISIDDIIVKGNKPNSIKEEVKTFVSGAFPNPASNLLTLNYTLPKTSSIDLLVYDFNGRLVDSKNIGMQIAGEQSITHNVSSLANGEYTFVIRSSFGTTSQKVIVNK